MQSYSSVEKSLSMPLEIFVMAFTHSTSLYFMSTWKETPIFLLDCDICIQSAPHILKTEAPKLQSLWGKEGRADYAKPIKALSGRLPKQQSLAPGEITRTQETGDGQFTLAIAVAGRLQMPRHPIQGRARQGRWYGEHSAGGTALNTGPRRQHHLTQPRAAQPACVSPGREPET